MTLSMIFNYFFYSLLFLWIHLSKIIIWIKYKWPFQMLQSDVTLFKNNPNLLLKLKYWYIKLSGNILPSLKFSSQDGFPFFQIPPLILYVNRSQWMPVLSWAGISRRRMSFNFTGLQNKEKKKGTPCSAKRENRNKLGKSEETEGAVGVAMIRIRAFFSGRESFLMD